MARGVDILEGLEAAKKDGDVKGRLERKVELRGVESEVWLEIAEVKSLLSGVCGSIAANVLL